MWEAFDKEIKKKSYGVLSQIIIMYKHILLERGHIANMGDFKEEEMFGFDHVGQESKNRMVQTFVSFVGNGWMNRTSRRTAGCTTTPTDTLFHHQMTPPSL
ncbi:hypothetical protein CBL_08582 [Carabus blaptoides fortunei]